MKKIAFLFLCFILTGCVRYPLFYPPKVVELDPMEIMGASGQALSGRVFMSTCMANSWGDSYSSRQIALEKMAKKAHELGFKYFTMIAHQNTINEKTGYLPINQVTEQTSSNIHLWGTNNQHVNGNVSSVTTQPMVYQYTNRLPVFTGIFILLYDHEIEYAKNIYTVENYL